MATVQQVANASLKRILVQGDEADLQPSEYDDYIFALNVWMLNLDAEGVQLGYTEVSKLSDIITVPAGALRGIIQNLAIEVAPEYNGTVTDTLRVAAAQSLKTMEKLGIVIPNSHYASTLPRGSGNTGCDLSLYTSAFYQGQEAEILAETTGAIGLETNTESKIEN